ncbi:rRNA maturation RNase YbeY [Methyloligella sp. 2.7D]|uniref:rRNA maturation RNase YbeY n=1 Tax=unclassified Methyloligella TaxID=2625955 RepID=UPI00157E09C7|nr:rRNA maturation RNase YbeY [Methyloligella sp. GL2]QKP78604.1 rRNA maturation RNase YbeY [Methyloligella sp. GL2]
MSDDVPSTIEAPLGAALAEPEPEPGDLSIALVVREGVWPDEAVGESALVQAAKAAFAAAADGARKAGLIAEGPYEVSILLTGDDEIRTLNRDYRDKDSATNVLSFPAGESFALPGEPAALGDIVLSFDTLAREAEAQGLSLHDHAVHLVIHGMLHLLGFDHMEEEEAAEMERLETALLQRFGIADPYADPPLSQNSEISG